MKIIEMGKLPQEKTAVTQCTNCKTKVEVTQGEAKLHSDQRDGDFYSVLCPLDGCGRQINIAAKLFK